MSDGRVWSVGDDVDTDMLAPGHAMKFGIDVIAKYSLENLRPEFASQVRRGDFIVAGNNFGIGSSREQAAQVLVFLGVRAVIAQSYGGLFFRNAFNVGLLLLTLPNASELKDQEQLDFNVGDLTVKRANGQLMQCDPIPEFLLNMAHLGGLLPTLEATLKQRK